MKKSIVCIGGSRGIGFETVKQLIEKKYRVYLFSRSSIDLHSELLKQHPYDVSENFPVEQLPETIDGYIYFPGSINLRPFERFSLEEFQTDININYLNNIKILQQIMPWLKKSNQDPSVVFFSTVAVQTGMSFHASISGAKGALEGLTRALAAEYAPKIRFNCIAPSLTDTPLAQKITSNEKMREASATKHPLKRIGSAEDIANLAVFLLSDQSSWMTGQILACDGGMSSLK